MKPITISSTKAEILSAYQELRQQAEEATLVRVATSLPKLPQKTATGVLAEAIEKLGDLVVTLRQFKADQVETERQTEQQLSQFQVDLKRSKEELEYELKKVRREKADELEVDLRSRRREEEEKLFQGRRELQLEQEAMREQIEEVKHLRQQVSQFPAELERKIKDAVVEARSEEQAVAKAARELLEKQWEGERAVAQVKTDNLRELANKQREEISQLRSQLEQAVGQLKEVAISVIDSRRPVGVAEEAEKR